MHETPGTMGKPGAAVLAIAREHAVYARRVKARARLAAQLANMDAWITAFEENQRRTHAEEAAPEPTSTPPAPQDCGEWSGPNEANARDLARATGATMSGADLQRMLRHALQTHTRRESG